MGSHTLYCFWKDEYINKWVIRDIHKLNNTTYKMGNELILKLLKSNNSLKNITELFIKYLDFIKEKKINKESIDEIDNILAAQSLYGLLQLKLYKEDDLIIILKNKRCLHKIKNTKFIN